MTRIKYQSVNSQWPAGTNEGRTIKPDDHEAASAVRRLYRFAFKRSWTGKVKIVRGNRRGKISGGVIYVNPDRWGGGWHEVIHFMSHRCAFRLHPLAPAHSTQHAFLEKQMIAYAVRSGWLAGKLKSKAAPKPPVDHVAKRAASVAARLASWEAKRKRAERAIRVLKRKAAYYARKPAPARLAEAA